MKKKIGAFIIMMVMMLSLVACGKVPGEKLKEMDTLVLDCKVLIDDTYKEIEKINNTGYEDVQEAYEMTITALNAVDTEYISMKKDIDDTREDMSEKMVDEIISALKKTKIDLEQMKQDAISGRKEIEKEISIIEEDVAAGKFSEGTGKGISEGIGEGTGKGISEGIGEGVGEGVGKEVGEEISEGVGEGIGTSTMPTKDEINLMLSYNTGNWSDLLQDEKWTAVQTTLRMWENVDGYIESDIDEVLSNADFQMNTYIRNKVDISFFETVCDIYGIDKNNYLK